MLLQTKNSRQLTLAAIAYAALAGCGGGGGSSGASNAPVATMPAPNPSPAPPTVTASLNLAKIFVGETAAISWQSTNATSCSISGVDIAGNGTSGTVNVVPKNGGVLSYTVTCTGAGGSAKKDLSLTVPMPVLPTSYQNKNNITFDDTQVPTVRSLGVPKVQKDEQDSVERSITFGDFFQSGAYSAFVSSSRVARIYGTDIPDTNGVGYFLKLDSAGKWVDGSAELFSSEADRATCISASYSITADFNNDKRPDVYISCSGYDGPTSAVYGSAKYREIYHSNQVLLLSQADGKYKRIEIPVRIYGHKAQAADINRDGFVDIVTTDVDNPNQTNKCGVPFILFGNGDGTFTRDDKLIPEKALTTLLPSCSMYNVDLIPVDGRLDLLVGSATNAAWFKGAALGFDFNSGILLEMPISIAYKVQYQFPLDFVYDTASASLYAFTATTTVLTVGTEFATVKYDRSGSLVSIVHTWFNPNDANFSSYSGQIKPSALDSRYILAYTGGCFTSVNTGICGIKIPR